MQVAVREFTAGDKVRTIQGERDYGFIPAGTEVTLERRRNTKHWNAYGRTKRGCRPMRVTESNLVHA